MQKVVVRRIRDTKMGTKHVRRNDAIAYGVASLKR